MLHIQRLKNYFLPNILNIYVTFTQEYFADVRPIFEVEWLARS